MINQNVERAKPLGLIFMVSLGVLTLTAGLLLTWFIPLEAATLGSGAHIGSFTGAQSINALVPLVYTSAVLMIGVGLIGMAAAGMAGFGPLAHIVTQAAFLLRPVDLGERVALESGPVSDADGFFAQHMNK